MTKADLCKKITKTCVALLVSKYEYQNKSTTTCVALHRFLTSTWHRSIQFTWHHIPLGSHPLYNTPWHQLSLAHSPIGTTRHQLPGITPLVTRHPTHIGCLFIWHIFSNQTHLLNRSSISLWVLLQHGFYQSLGSYAYSVSRFIRFYQSLGSCMIYGSCITYGLPFHLASRFTWQASQSAHPCFTLLRLCFYCTAFYMFSATLKRSFSERLPKMYIIR